MLQGLAQPLNAERGSVQLVRTSRRSGSSRLLASQPVKPPLLPQRRTVRRHGIFAHAQLVLAPLFAREDIWLCVLISGRRWHSFRSIHLDVLGAGLSFGLTVAAGGLSFVCRSSDAVNAWAT